MKNLKTLQTLSKMGKILSRIAFVFAIIGACGCIIGLLSVTFGNGSAIKIGGVTLHSMLAISDNYNLKSVSAVLAAWLIVCAGEAVLAKFAEIYFKNELTVGTPFTQEGAKELKRLGIMTIAVPIGCAVLAEIVQGIAAGFMNVEATGWMDMHYDNEASVVLGIMFLVGSVICSYGAELSGEKQETKEE